MKMLLYIPISFILLLSFSANAQPEVPVEEWTGKTIMFIGAHPDDDARSFGTMAMLQDNGNEVYVVLLTSGNVGTQDPDISMTDLARIRKHEEINALAALGIAAKNYINLGYNDGMLELEEEKEVISRLVRLIRTYKPDVLIAFDPGKGKMRWHKADHRAACKLAVDACRAAMWPLLYEGQIIHEGLTQHEVREYLLFDGFQEDINVEVDISDYYNQKVEGMMQYVSQYTSAWSDYSGPEISDQEKAELKESIEKRVIQKNGKFVEEFRYYNGYPDGIGR